MWLRVTVDGNNDLLLGNVYIPPSGSPYSDSEGFNRVSAELETLTCSKNIQVCLTGDFNARCGVKSEYVVESDVEPSDFDIDPILYRTLLNQREMDDKGIPCKRVSSDHHINEYGNRLIEFCQCHALYICNGRIGRDCNEGSFTTVKRSIVDYVIGSTGVLTNMNEFAISNFDSMFSDIHRPILCNLRISLDISTNDP